ncbi:MAG TPA: SpaH/EbpB family LPXTG-anchored major pilin [Candidatus Mediterraneibacter guildfordensis]|nr:SpaH/EbpB family LPXTG-anchored major pilin [Candidatus Mediterraneibacter guildfordensis]
MKTKLRNTWFSKLMALCLAVVMMLSMSMTVFATVETDPDTGVITSTGTITVEGMATDNGATLNAYKVIDINFDSETQQPVEPVYHWTETMAAWLRGDGAAAYGSYIGTNGEVTAAYMNLTASELSAFYKAVQAANILTTPDATGTMANQTATLSPAVPAGEYLVLASKSGAVYQPMTAKVDITYSETEKEWMVEGATIALKGSAPDIEKEATDSDLSVKIGDVVDYKLTVDIPSYPENATVTRFVIGDTLSSGLTLDTSSIKIFIGDESTELPNTYYTLSTAVTNGFEFDLTNHYTDIKTAYPTSEKIYVTYSATVNANAFEADDLGNDAFIGYTNDPYEDSDSKTETEETVYTYAIDVTKYAKGESNPLAGAVFQLSNENGVMSFVSLGNGVYRPAENATEATTTDLSAVNGQLIIKGIDLGEYTLKETEAPDGYVLPDDGIVIVLVDDEPDGALDQESAASGTTLREDSVSVSGNTLSLDVDNTNYEDEGFQLPTTGGMGTMIFTIAGILLMGGAVALIVVEARKKRG